MPLTLVTSEPAHADREALVRRLGVAIFLGAIALGLATITRVPRFQAVRIRQLLDEISRP